MTLLRSIASACLVAGLAATTVTACSWPGKDDGDDVGDRPKVHLWSTADVTPFSQVTAVDGVGVALGTDQGKVYVVGLEPTTGQLLWRRETTPSVVPRGISMSFATLGSHVAYLSTTRDGSWRARMHVVAARTGETVAYSSVEKFVRHPDVCDDDPKAFCAQVSRGSGSRAAVHEVRLTPSEPKDGVKPAKQAVRGTSLAGGGLSGDWDGPQRLLRIIDGRTVWSQKSSVLGPRTDLRYGWHLHHDETADVFIGTVGRKPKNEKARSFSLADTSTAGLRASDGQLLWSDEGSDYGCGSTVGSIEIDDKQTSYLRCRSTGTMSWPKGGGKIRWKDVTVTLERFDPVTGRTMWQVPLGEATGLLRGGSEDARLLIDDRRQAFRTGEKVVTVDLVSGQVADMPPTTVAWCPQEQDVRDPLAAPEDGRIQYVRGGELAHPCDVNGKPVDTVPTTWPSDAVASMPDGVVIAATPDAFVGYGPKGAKQAAEAKAAGSSVEVWKNTDVTPFSPVENIDGVAVAVIRKGKRLYAAGFDPATGTQLWRHELALAMVSRYRAPYVLPVGERAGFFTPAKKSSQARFTLVDPHTGTVLGRSAARAFISPPAPCGDGTEDVCSLTASRPDDWANPGYQAWRFSAADARLQLDKARTAHWRDRGTELLAPGLFSTFRGYKEHVIGVRENGKVLWQAPMTTLTKVGRYVDNVLYDPRSDVIVLSPKREGDDVSRTESIGLRRVDGKVLWHDRGSATDCSSAGGGTTSPYLPSGGRELPTPQATSGAAVASAFFRCRFKGVWTTEANGNQWVKGAHATVERFDPATGKTLWAVDLDEGSGVLSGAGLGAAGTTRIVDDAHLSFGTGADHLIVDVETGKVSVAERTQPAWCWKTKEAAYHAKRQDGFGDKAVVFSGLLLERCTLGSGGSDAPVGQVPEAVSTAFDGGLKLVATPKGFIGYR